MKQAMKVTGHVKTCANHKQNQVTVKDYSYSVACDMETITLDQKWLIDCLDMYSECLNNERAIYPSGEQNAALALFRRLHLYESLIQATRCLAVDILNQMEEVKERACAANGCKGESQTMQRSVTAQ